MGTKDEKDKVDNTNDIKDLETNHLIDLYKEVESFMSFLYDEQKKNMKEDE